jgi:hypothetical protein
MEQPKGNEWRKWSAIKQERERERDEIPLACQQHDGERLKGREEKAAPPPLPARLWFFLGQERKRPMTPFREVWQRIITLREGKN